MRVSWYRVSTVVAAAVALLASGSVAARADSAVVLPLHGFHSIVLDQARGHVFLSDPVDGEVYVTDFSGAAVATLTGEFGASGMVLDAGTLYVARCNGGAIDEIDASTLTVTGSISVASGPAGSCNLAAAGGRLWYGTSDQIAPLGSVTIAAPHTSTTYTSIDSMLNPVFAASPTDPNLLVAANLTCPSGTYVYNVSTDPPTLVSSASIGVGDCVRDMALTPDGTGLIAAAGAVGIYRLSDLSQIASYPTVSDANAVAESADGTYLSIGMNGLGSDEVVDFRNGSTTPFRSHPWQLASDSTDHALVMTSDGHHMFGVEQGSSFYVLTILDGPAQLRPTLTLTASRTVITYGTSISLAVHLSAHATNNQVDIYRTPNRGTRFKLATLTVGATGDAAMTTRPAYSGVYGARTTGDETYAAVRAAGHFVTVRAAVVQTLSRWYGTSGLSRLYHVGVAPLVTAQVGPNKHGKCVRFSLGVRLANGSWNAILSRCFTLGLRSRTKVSIVGLAQGHTYRTRVYYRGDSLNAAHSSVYRYFRVTT